jgi:hypothetical protein
MFSALLAFVQTQDEAVEILQRSARTGEETSAAWQQNWELVINSSSSGVWSATVTIATALGALSLVWLSIKEMPEIIEKNLWDKLADILVIPLAMIIFLSANGALAAVAVRFSHQVSMYLIRSAQSSQLASGSLDAITRSTFTNQQVKREIDAQVQQCDTLQPSERAACLKEVGEKANELINNGKAWGVINSDTIIDLPSEMFGTINPLTSPLRLIEIFLTWWQWAWANLLEASLLLSALFMPVAIGLTMLPVGGGRAIFSWLSGTLGAYGTYFAYILLVGFVAMVLNNQPTLMFRGGDIGLTTFLAIFAPAFAGAMGIIGGAQLFSAFRSTQTRIIAAVSGIGGVVFTGLSKAFGRF